MPPNDPIAQAGSSLAILTDMPQPLDYLDDLVKFDDAAKLKILRDNTRELNELRPA